MELELQLEVEMEIELEVEMVPELEIELELKLGLELEAESGLELEPGMEAQSQWEHLKTNTTKKHQVCGQFRNSQYNR